VHVRAWLTAKHVGDPRTLSVVRPPTAPAEITFMALDTGAAERAIDVLKNVFNPS
jgi:hypothetical protein